MHQATNCSLTNLIMTTSKTHHSARVEANRATHRVVLAMPCPTGVRSCTPTHQLRGSSCPTLPADTHPPSCGHHPTKTQWMPSQPPARSPKPPTQPSPRGTQPGTASQLSAATQPEATQQPEAHHCQLRPKIPHDAPTLSLLPAASSCALWPPAAPQPECKPLGLQPSPARDRPQDVINPTPSP